MFKRKRGSSIKGRSSKRFKGGKSVFSRPSPYGFRGAGFASSSRNSSGTLIANGALAAGGANQPDRLRIKFKTYLNGTFTSTSGATGGCYISLNSMKTPFNNLGSSTHENPTFNNLSVIYDRYRVTKAKLTLNFSPLNSSESPVPLFVALSAFDPEVNAVTISTFQQVIESRMGRFKVAPSINGYNGKPVTLKLAATPEAVSGVTQVEVTASEQFSAGVTIAASASDPAQLMRFYIIWQANDGATTTSQSVDLILTQWVEMYGRAQYA